MITKVTCAKCMKVFDELDINEAVKKYAHLRPITCPSCPKGVKA